MTKKIVATFLSVLMLVSTSAPVLAASTIEISGNGADTTNTASVTNTQATVVAQTNNASITNNVNANTNTGNNNASRNTNGDVSIDTGNAKTTVSVSNTANSNVADVNTCNCDADVNVKISGNGDSSTNNANASLTDTTVLAQTNDADITNNVSATADTGSNRARRNTGGDVEIETGNATTQVGIVNQANSNWAKVGGGSGNGSISLLITGNGADSDNDINLDLGRDILLQQGNDADVNNNVLADAQTGYNIANRNTGGEVTIDTGNATSKVMADTAINFNWAQIDCDCLTDVTAKIAKNGDSSDNDLIAALDDSRNVFQDNDCSESCIDNNIGTTGDTGSNRVRRNTGDVDGDPSITTGDAWSSTDVENEGNSNIFGKTTGNVFPPFGGTSGVNLNITFDLQDLLGALGIHIS